MNHAAITTLREKCPNTEFFLVLIFQSEYGKIRTRKNSVFAHFSNSAIVTSVSRSNRSKMFFEIGALNYFATFTGKHLCWSVLLKLIKKRLQNMCFPVNIAKFLTLSVFVTRSAGHDTNPHSNSNISEMVKVSIVLTRTFLKEYSISFLVISRLIDFSQVVL